MKVKTDELAGAALDWAAAKCEGLLGFGYRTDGERFAIEDSDGQVEGFMPSTDWAQGGPIIEREGISVMENLPSMPENNWEAKPSITAKGAGGKWGNGPTPLIAAMRCYVASKLGDEVEIPEGLK